MQHPAENRDTITVTEPTTANAIPAAAHLFRKAPEQKFLKSVELSAEDAGQNLAAAKVIQTPAEPPDTVIMTAETIHRLIAEFTDTITATEWTIAGAIQAVPNRKSLSAKFAEKLIMQEKIIPALKI